MTGTLPKRVGRAARRGAALAGLAACSLGAQPSHAQLAVDEVAIAAALASGAPGPEWFFIVGVLGEGLTSGAVMPPAGGALPLTDAGGGGLELELEAGPFASFAALQAAHPAGSYTITINGGHTVTLVWDPTEPVGAGGAPSLVIDSPADGATGVSATPDVAFTLDCTNCDDLNLELQSIAGATFGFGELDVGTFTNPIPFAAMDSSGGETELPLGPVDALLLAGLVEFADSSFDAPSALPPFTYIEAGLVSAVSTFTVPEPGAVVAAVAALATLGLLRSRPS